MIKHFSMKITSMSLKVWKWQVFLGEKATCVKVKVQVGVFKLRRPWSCKDDFVSFAEKLRNNEYFEVQQQHKFSLQVVNV